MRLNRFIANSLGLSRRKADDFIAAGNVLVNDQLAKLGQKIEESDQVTVNGELLSGKPQEIVTILLNKPVGYVCSRDGQGSKTVFELLPPELQNLQTVGRLDKDSSGLLVLTNDGKLANEMTHPSFEKTKVYEVSLDHELSENDLEKINQGIELEDGLSKMRVEKTSYDIYTVTMSEGKNRQIRRTFAALSYKVVRLHRIQFGPYKIGDIQNGSFTDGLVI